MTEPTPRQPEPDRERPIWGEHVVPGEDFSTNGQRRSGSFGSTGSIGSAGSFGSADSFGSAGSYGPAGGFDLRGGLRFRGPGRPDSEAALRQYLLTRALGRSVLNTVQWSAIAILLLAVGCWLGGLKVLAVLIGLVAVVVLVVRSLLSALGRRLSGADRLGAAEPQVRRLVARTGRRLRRELRRVGLPGSPWAPLLIALRLLRPHRRQQTAMALARIDLSNVVPPSQVDELHLLLQSTRPLA